MCGIVGFLDKTGRHHPETGRVVLTMLVALGCRGPDSAGLAILGEPGRRHGWNLRISPVEGAAEALESLSGLVEDVTLEPTVEGATLRVFLQPRVGVTPEMIERALGAHRGGLEVLCLGEQIDLVKQVGSPAKLEETYRVSRWGGAVAIGHTRMSTESRIDLSHSQPFWAHGVLDLATAHNGHVTNYHQLRRQYEQEGVTFYTDNDSEVIGVYLRDRLEKGKTLAEAMADSLRDLDGAFNYLVASPVGLGVVRDRFGFKPLVVAETDRFVAVATEEIALRRALPAPFRVVEPPIGRAMLFPIEADEPMLIASAGMG